MMHNQYKMTRHLLLLATALPLAAQFISSDTYTRYELLAPDTHQFRIVYEVTETTPLAKFHYNIIRPGSEATDEAAYDAATGKPLKFEMVTGAQAKKDSPEQNFTADAQYIKIQLGHQVIGDSEYRLRIEKTYKDEKSYFSQKDTIVFTRGLGIPRNSVVLPAGYELVQTSMAAQVLAEPDGRLRLGFLNPGSGGQLEVKIVARLAPPGFKTSTAKMPTERAHQDREILYELLDPASNAFRITHDFTETRPGRAHYFNVVRTGSHVTDPGSLDLDSGNPLKYEVMTGKQAKARKIPLDEGNDDSEVVVTFFDKPIAPGSSMRLRLMETYTDPKSYYMDGDELVWTRTFGRPRNTVVLPKGWTITAMDTPAVVQTLKDGRVSVYTVNPRNDEVKVFFRARKRPEAKP